MNNAANVIVNILVNSQTAAAGLQPFNNLMLQIQVGARQAATNAANSFQSIFGANFFANLASGMVQSMTAGFRSLLTDAINTASKFESAFAGIGSIAKNVGLNAADTIDTVKNLDLVKSGLLTIGDAAVATKNLLATGFSLPQAIELIRRFGDTAAFGRQSALSFGYAISSATEGIKNQNSILVDNAGVTKNLSVILKERGFEIQDLSDKVKGASAREALYQGLLKETSLQMGDSNKLLDTTQGALVRVDSAWQRFLASLGETITQSAIVKTALSGIVGVLDFMGKNTGTVIALTASFTVLTAAVALSTTSFSALTFAQITNAAASTNFVKLIQTAILVLSDFRYATALTAGEVALLSGGMLAIVGIIGAAVYAIYSYSTAQQSAVDISKDAIASTTKQIESLKGLQAGLEATNFANQTAESKQSILAESYNLLNRESKTRVDVLALESQATSENATRTAQLRDEIVKLSLAKNEELQIFSRLNAAKLAEVGGEFANNQKELDFLKQRINLLTETQKKLAESSSGLSSAELTKAGINSNLFLQFSKGDQIASVNKLLEINNKRYGEIAESQDKVRKSAIPLIEKQSILNKELNTTTNAALENAFANGLLKDDLANSKSATDSLIGSTNASATAQKNSVGAINSVTNAINDQISAYYALTDVQSMSGARKKILDSLANEVAESSIYPNQDPKKNAKEILKQRLDNDIPLRAIIEEEQKFQKAKKVIDDTLFPKEEKVRKAKSSYDTLSDGLKKLRAEVNSFTNLTSRSFQIRFEKEELERVKRDFEQILDLRRELGIELTKQLPTTAGGARAEVEQLERVKNLRDDVLKVYREIQDGEDKLVLARITASANVVDAQTRADTAYLNGLRERRDAEEQLTADIANELRKRQYSAENSARSIEDAQATAYKEFLSDLSTKDSERLKQIARIQLLSGEIFAGNKVINAGAAIAGGAKPEASPVIGRLDKSNELLKQILDAVKVSQLGGSNEAIIGSGSSVSASEAIRNAPTKRAAEVLAATIAPSKFDAMLRKAATIAAKENGIDPDTAFILLKSTLFRESSGQANKVSEKGAAGYFQQLTGTSKGLGVKNPNDFQSAATGAARYLLRGFGGQGYVKGGIDEAYATYFAGGGGGNRGAKTREYVSSQSYVYENARKILFPDEFSTPTPPVKTTNQIAPVVPPATDGGGNGNFANITIAGRQRVNPLASLLGDFYGLPDASQQSLEGLSPQSLNGISAYLDAQKEFNDTTKEQTISTDRLNTARRVNFEQVRELQVAEAQLDALLKGDSLATREAVTDAEISRNKSYAASLRTLIQTNDYLEKLRTNDAQAIGEIITGADAERATATAKAYQDIVKAKDFLAKYAAGDKTVFEYLAKTREAARTNDAQNLTIEVDNLKAQSATGGRDAGLEKLRFEKEYYSTIIAVGQTEAELDQLRQLRANPTFVNFTRENDTLSEQLSIERKLFNLENDRANAGVNQALRERLAVEQELTEIYLDEFRAGEDAAVARVRLADLSVFHEARANARILEHIASMKSLTDVYTDAKVAVVDKVWSGLDTLFGRLTTKIPFVGSILKDILSSITKILINPFILKLLGLDKTTGGAGAGGGLFGVSSGGGAGGVVGGAASSVFTGGGGAGAGNFLNAFIPTAPNAASGGSFNPNSASGLQSILQSVVGGGGGSSPNRAQLQSLLGTTGLSGLGIGDLHEAGHGANAIGGAAQSVGGSFLSQLFGGKIDLKGLGKTVGGLAPVLGAGLGASLGGSSITGQVIGAGGGILAGGVLSALIGGSLTGAATGGIFGTIGGVLGISAGATAGIALAIAPLLLLGSYFLGRNKLRRQEEKQRTQILGDAKKQLTDILNQTRAGNLDSVSALSQAQAIRDAYLQQVGQLKDKKTRNIAIATVRELDSIIEQIKVAGRASDFAKAQDDAFVPTFDGGGMNSYVNASAAQSRASFNDRHLALFNADTEAILTRQNVYSLGGYKSLNRAGVKGAGLFTGNSVRSEQAYSNRSSGDGSAATGDKPIYNVIVFGDDEKDKLISKSSGRAIIRVVKPLIYAGQDDGFVDTIEGKLAGEF